MTFTDATTQNYATLHFSPGATDIRPGQGVNYEDPLFPKIAPAPFRCSTEPKSPGAVSLSATAFSIIEDVSVEQDARFLAANFSARFGIGSASAAVDYARQQKTERKVIYLLLEEIADGWSIGDADAVWANEPEEETIDDYLARRRSFLLNYGSHYIFSISLGSRLVIRAAYESQDLQERNVFSAHIRAAASNWGAEGNFSSGEEHKLKLEKMTVELAIVCGEMKPSGQAILFGLPDVKKFLQAVKAGEIVITGGPVRAEIASYFGTLIKYPRCQEVLAAKPIKKVEAAFGVPSGTVLAWKPPLDAVVWDAGAMVDVIPPDGWAICNGTQGTPDLSDKFILGAVAAKNIGEAVGQAQTVLPDRTIVVKSTGFNAEMSPHPNGGPWSGQPWYPPFHGLNSAGVLPGQEFSNIPPSIKLLYIMKL